MAAGKKTGGRKKGSLNKATRALQRVTRVTVAKATAPGQLTPLEIMLGNARHFFQLALDAEAILEGKTAQEILGSNTEISPDDQLKLLLAEVRQMVDLRLNAQSCARDAATYMHPRLAPAEPGRRTDEVVPLAERLKAYATAKAIEASKGKVVALQRKA